MRLKFVPLALVLLVSAFTADDAHAQRPGQIDSDRAGAVSLRYQLARGNSQTYALTAEFSSEGLDGTNGERMTMSLSMPVTYEVQSVDRAGVALVATSLRDATVSVTENESAASGDSIAGSLRSARLTQALAPDGTVTERSGAFETRNNRDVYALGFISDTLAIRWMQFPQEPVAIGDSWLQIVPMDMHDAETGLNATVSVRYTLAGFANVGSAEVAVIDAVYSTAVDGQMVAASGRSVRVVGRGLGEGYILFDHRAGRVRELSMDNGIVLTATENNGQRTVRTFTQDATLRAQVIAAVTPE